MPASVATWWGGGGCGPGPHVNLPDKRLSVRRLARTLVSVVGENVPVGRDRE